MMRRDRFGASAKKDTVHTTLKNKLDDANRMSHNILLSNINDPADRRRSSSQENDCSTYNSSVTTHRDSNTRQDKWMRIFSLHLITLSLLVTNITAEMNCTKGISTLGLPSAPPRVIEGSFCIVQSTYDRDLYLYWKPITKIEGNGDDFRYQFSYMEGNNIIILRPQELTEISAKIERFSLASYKLEIAATNILGANYAHTATIFIPQEYSRICEPMEFKVSRSNVGVYELNWLPPVQCEKMETYITDYTIFWCQNDSENPKLCTSDLDWIRVSNKSTSSTVTVSKPSDEYQFAIAANTDAGGSSGMVWASYFINSTRKGNKREKEYLVARYLQTRRIDAQAIELSWKQVCSNQVESYNIYYCPAHSPHNLACKGASLNFKIKGPTKTYTLIHNLMPYTLYAIKITVLTKYSEGPFSNIVYNTTREDAPYTPPRNLQTIHVTNTTAFSWEPSQIMDAILTAYQPNV